MASKSSKQEAHYREYPGLIASAHLIAAAPDMLKALKAVLDGVAWSELEPGHFVGLQLIVRAAIDKAEGRT